MKFVKLAALASAFAMPVMADEFAPLMRDCSETPFTASVQSKAPIQTNSTPVGVLAVGVDTETLM